jgi:hypothetical protein
MAKLGPRALAALYGQLTSAKLAQEISRLRRQADAADGLINKLVYELYGLSGDEMETV